jgi:cell division protein FtsL
MKPFLAGLAIIGLLLLFVWERVEIVRVGYRIEQLKTRLLALQREQAELRAQVSAVTAPDRLAKAAMELGMVPPQPGQVIAVSPTETNSETGEGRLEISVASTKPVRRKP